MLKEHLDMCREEDDSSNILDLHIMANYESEEEEENESNDHNDDNDDNDDYLKDLNIEGIHKLYIEQ